MSDRYATQRIPFARPTGVTHPAEIYDGADLMRRCPRAGAYDAMRLPSILNGRPVPPPTVAAPASPRRIVTERARISVSEVLEPADEGPEDFRTPPEHAPIVGANGYRPRLGGLAESVILDLRAMPSGVAYTCREIQAIFRVFRHSVDAGLSRCLEAGLLIRVKKGRCLAYALPVEPTASPSLSLTHEPRALTDAA